MLAGEIGKNGDFVLPQYHATSKAPVLRAAVNGNFFRLSNGNSVVTFTLNEKSVTANILHKSVLYVAPSPDGSKLSTDDGYYSADMKSVRAQDPSVPSTIARLYLGLQNPTGKNTSQLRSFPVKGSINSQETGRSVFTLPELTEMAGQYEFPQQGNNIAFDRRYHIFAKSSLLVTIPPSNDRIILRMLQLPEDKGVNNQLPIPEMRTWTDNSGTHRFNATLITSKDDHVELRSVDGRVVSVPISRLSKSDLEYVKTLNGLDVEVARTQSVYSYLKIQGPTGNNETSGKNFYIDGFKIGMQLKPTKRGALVHAEGWSLHFEAEEGGFLKVGQYSNAERAPFTKDLPGISIFGEGYGCNQVSGEFKVLEIEFKGESIHRLAIDFSQSCENQKPQLTGKLRFNSTVR